MPAQVTQRLAPCSSSGCPQQGQHLPVWVTSFGPEEQCLGKEGSRVSLGRDINRGLPRSGRGQTSPNLPWDLSTLSWVGKDTPHPNLWPRCHQTIGREFLPPQKGPGMKQKKETDTFSDTLGSDASSINCTSTKCPEVPPSWTCPPSCGNAPARCCLRAPVHALPSPGTPFLQA